MCPFCYLGRRSLEEYQNRRDSELQINWKPFDLRSQKRGPDGEIDHSVDDGKDDAYFDQVRQNVARLKTEYDADEMLAFDETIFEVLWIDGRDIGDVDVLANIADKTGLDGDEIRAAISDEQLRDRLRKQFIEAQQDGVTGVPTFVYDGYGARGAVPPEQLEQLVEGA